MDREQNRRPRNESPSRPQRGRGVGRRNWRGNRTPTGSRSSHDHSQSEDGRESRRVDRNQFEGQQMLRLTRLEDLNVMKPEEIVIGQRDRHSISMDREQNPRPRNGSPSRTQRGRGVGRRGNRIRTGSRSSHDHSQPEDGRESRRVNRNQFEGQKMLRFKRLEDLSVMEPEEIVIELACKSIGFKELLDSKTLNGDTLVLIMRVLKKVCLVSLKTNKMMIINLAVNENFQKALQDFILHTMFADSKEKRNNSYFWSDIDGFFSNALTTFQNIFDTIPTKACEVLDKTLDICIHTLRNLLEQNLVRQEMADSFSKLHKKLKMYRDEIEVKRTTKSTTDDYYYEEPPNHFRELSIYPNNDEIFSNAFVRKNLIDRPYNSVDHYLDVQFRLLKEDFVAPLREGILEYRSSNSTFTTTKKFSNVRIHKEVKFLTPFCSKDKAGVLLQFEDVKLKKKGKKYSYTKRFMFGSLLCFTRDNFETLLFGKVIERDQKQLDKGEVLVGFEPGHDNYELNVPYVMVECAVYFEPYYHVLAALQSIFEHDFAMQRYIIDVNPDIVRPSYLHNTSVYKIDDFNVSLFGNYWPTADQLRLNESQYRAFKAGLTQEYAVIQGPPGTGKTYLGLKVATTLIKNRSHWHNGSPILVVCYTNHALDQFLEGITTVTKNVVRVGGQCKNKNLEKFTLKEKRKVLSSRILNKRSHNYGKVLYSLRHDLEFYVGQIKKFSNQIEQIRGNNCVVINFKQFARIDEDYVNSWFHKAEAEEIREWLLGRVKVNENRRSIQLERVKREMTDDHIESTANEFDEILNCQMMLDAIEVDDFIISGDGKLSDAFFLLKVDDMLTAVKKIRTEIELFEDDDGHSVYSKKIQLTEVMYKLLDDIEYIESRFEQFRNVNIPKKPAGCNLTYPMMMRPEERWSLYFHWVQKYEKFLIDSLAANEMERKEVYKQYVELQALQDVEVMSEMEVVGMTTTGAARLQSVLNSLRSPIVIVEEAAEVLEAHIVVSLTSHCQHLILIGDHRQLRPSTASYHMEVAFNLGISLFERMVLNNIQCHTLTVQHRMRPEIATLIVPAVYPKLDNHPSVESFPKISCIDTNLYFIDHHNEESELFDSKMNPHEVKYLLLLARHLILNGYKPEDITILAAYSAQMYTFWEERKKYSNLLQDINIKVLDNYQGEESKIILLSLVRNSPNGKIGFLKIENRVCVALSRAREGLYIMGNMGQLCKNSEIWPKVKNALVNANALGRSLALRCQIHTDNVTQVTFLDDFGNVSEGGCHEMCDAIMNCGHVCPKVCHIMDRQHETISCKANCRRILCEREHLCPKMCYEECGPCMKLLKMRLKCAHVVHVACSTDLATVKCMELVTAQLPCGHTDSNKPCFISNELHNCPFPCEIRVEPCGHSCSLKCHIRNDPDHINYTCRKKCEKAAKGCSTGTHKCKLDCYEECSLCEIIVEKKRTTCAHRVQIRCFEDPDTIKCNMGCRRLLPCGHACKKKCSEPCGDCRVKVIKELDICKHKVKVKCNETPTRDCCTGQCSLLLSCGHPCQAKCNEPCTKVCKHLVDHNKVADCGHKFKIACYLTNEVIPGNSYKLLKFCDEPCPATLDCGHHCSGTCGSCAQGRIHIACNQKCGRILICGHECPFPCREACQPCNRVCSYRCSHSACGKQCGEPCTKCVEKCQRRCPHSRCEKKCGDICSTPPCSVPCEQILKCGHPCVGFCGEPCPPLCRICNEEELTEMFFGTEDEEGARFVLLNECNHILESSGMEQWMEVKNDNAVSYRCCPKCKTPLCSTQRYSDHIKANLQDVYAVKLKYFGKPKDNEKVRSKLFKKLEELESLTKQISGAPLLLNEFLTNAKAFVRLVQQGRKVTLNASTARIYMSKVQLLENIVKAYTSSNLLRESSQKVAKEDMEFLLGFLLHLGGTNQEINDFEKEIDRYSLKVQLLKLQDDQDVFKAAIYGNSSNKKRYESVYYNLLSIRVFNNSLTKEMREDIKQLSEKVGMQVQYERQEVVKAMKMAQGHWFKCPNGHFYAIGECGGAMQVGKCVECGVAIGGSSHRLLTDNRHAPEIDGSSHAAWSETANNLFNYEDFQD